MRASGSAVSFVMVLAMAAVGAASADAVPLFRHGFENTTFVRPAGYAQALRNPLKGFTTQSIRTGSSLHEWATLAHVYFRWNELENDATDGLDRILAASDQKFAQAPAHNIKVIPRVYLHWDGDQKYWPADMQADDYDSEQFRLRVVRLVQRLGQAWNNDPRVAFVELGIFGKWGEHHSPTPSASMQDLVGAAFRDAFPDKKVSVRHAWSEFRGFGFGEYWDSFAHHQQMWGHARGIDELNRSEGLYLDTYVGGEVAYNWGGWQIQPGDDPDDSVTDPLHRDFVYNAIRWLHATQLRWISNYDAGNAAARAGAEVLQRAMGYRFVLEAVEFTHRVDDGRLRVRAQIRNEGSAPFYYRWPLEVALLDPTTRQVVWRSTFAGVDIRDWTPGSEWTAPDFEPISGWPNFAVGAGWSSQPRQWAQLPGLHEASGEFALAAPQGVYVLALGILDPAGMTPSLRFASAQYWQGGRHPIGLVAVGTSGGGELPPDSVFDDPAADRSLNYTFQR
jgi:hypothetical protein